MKRWLFGFGFGALSSMAALAQVTIPVEFWDRPRTGERVAATEPIRQVVQDALGKPDTRVLIRHAPTTEQVMQAEELRSWLAALAIDPRRVVLRADLAPGAQSTIELGP